MWPLLLYGIALVLAELTTIRIAYCLLAVALFGLLVGLAILFWALRLVRMLPQLFVHSRQELTRNLRWLKSRPFTAAVTPHNRFQ
jgi:hypothetical protein